MTFVHALRHLQVIPFLPIASYRGLTVRRNPDLMPDLIWRRIRWQRYEVHEINAALKVIRKGDRVLELGAGLGLMAATLARESAASEIMAIEANPHLIPEIDRIHGANAVTGVQLDHAVLSVDGPGTAKFYERKPFWGSSLDPDAFPYVAEHDVPQKDFNEVLKTFQPQVITCDIEGGECDLFTPQADLSSVHSLVIETHGHKTGLAAVAGLFETLHGLGFAYLGKASRGDVVTFTRIP